MIWKLGVREFVWSIPLFVVPENAGKEGHSVICEKVAPIYEPLGRERINAVQARWQLCELPGFFDMGFETMVQHIMFRGSPPCADRPAL